MGVSLNIGTEQRSEGGDWTSGPLLVGNELGAAPSGPAVELVGPGGGDAVPEPAPLPAHPQAPMAWRVLFMVHDLRTDGGAETAVACTIRSLRRAGVQVHLAAVCAQGTSSGLAELSGLEPRFVKVFGADEVGHLRATWRLWKYLRRHRFHVVHSHLELANLLGVVVGKLAAVPALLPTAHSLWRHRSGRRVLVDRILARLATRFVVVTPAIARQFMEEDGIAPDRMAVIPNAVETERLCALGADERVALRKELGLPAGGPLVSHVGSLREPKRQVDLIEAFASVHCRRPAARLVIVGQGDLQEELEARIRRLGLEDVVTLMGFRPDAIRVVAASDLFVLSSEREGLPVTLLESFAVGTPTLSTAVGGIPELFDGGRYGVLVPPREPALLAARMVELLDDPELRAQLSARARSRAVTEYSENAVATRYLELFEALLPPCGTQ